MSARAALFLAAAALAGCDPARPAEPLAEAVAPAQPVAAPALPAPAPKVEKPAERPKPRPVVLARWGVARATVDGREDGGATDPQRLAVADDGTRVVVATSRLVDVWTKDRAAALRIQPKKWQDGFVGPDAARAYVVTADPTALETWDTALGQRVATWNPPSSSKGWAPRYFAHGFHPDTHALTVMAQSPDNCGLYDVSPVTGRGARTVPFKQMHEVADVLAVFPLRDGRYLTHYGPSMPNAERGFAWLGRDGARTRSPKLPADEKGFGYSQHPAVSQNEKYAALAGNRQLTVWDARTGAELWTWSKQYHFVSWCAFTRDRLVVWAASDYVAIGGGSGPRGLGSVLQMYDVPARKLLGEFRPGDDLPGQAVAFSPNGRYLALADGKGVAVLDAGAAFGLSP